MTSAQTPCPVCRDVCPPIGARIDVARSVGQHVVEIVLRCNTCGATFQLFAPLSEFTLISERKHVD